MSITTAAGGWVVSLGLALALCGRPAGARMGVIACGLLLAVPCFLDAPPLVRGFAMCLAALPFAIGVLSLAGPAEAGWRARLAWVGSWLGTRELARQPRRLDVGALVRLVVATLVLAGAMAVVKTYPPVGGTLGAVIPRWLAGGVMILAFAEVVTASHDFLTAASGAVAPALMRSPHLARSLAEFWSARWNPATSQLLFRLGFFRPLARRGPVTAMVAAFLASASAHMALAYMATGRAGLAWTCGAFFAVQPPLLLAERGLRVRRWPEPARHAWTLGALVVTCPLFVEPVLQIIEPSWGPPGMVAGPAAVVLLAVLAANTTVAATAWLAPVRRTQAGAVTLSSARRG